MIDPEIHQIAVWAVFACALATIIALQFLTAPYGRHARPGWGPTLPAPWAWLLMESPAVLLWLGVFALGSNSTQVAPLVLMGLWQAHYVQRTFIYPLRLRGARPMALSVIGMGFLFNGINAWVNAVQVGELGHYELSWLWSPPFLIGASIFVAGYAINHHADEVLRTLRAPGETGYKIPQGGLYRYVSCPNYLGELLEWVGWAIATWSLAGLSFAVFTAANLVPRALANHRWYLETFPDYPKDRRAVLPGLL